MLSAASILVGFLALPLVWVCGRLVFAKLLGVRILRVSWGFPFERLRLWSTTRGGRTYQVTWLPLGAFVSIDPLVSAWRRALLALSGPLVLLAFGYVMLLSFAGSASPPCEFAHALSGAPDAVTGTVVGYVEPNGPAAQAGVAPGDRILSIDGRPTTTFHEVAELVTERPNKLVICHLQRGTGETRVDVLLSARPDTTGSMIGFIGVRADVEVTVPLDDPWSYAHAITSSKIGRYVSLVASSVTGRAQVVDGLGGPAVVGRLRLPANSEPSVWDAAIRRRPGEARLPANAIPTVAFWSVFLALLHLLPVPPFALFELALVGIEAMRRKPRTESVQVVVSYVGFGFSCAILMLAVLSAVQ